ncbi:MAG: J domain-containing protein [Leptolyngbya sp.]|nr:J domain-containing protein [Leptolyngbya sp.]
MQNFRNYYEILGVSREADFSTIKQAYRKLARQYHPDLNPGNQVAEEKFKLLGEAYEILSDQDKRAQYEQFSQYWKQKGFQRKPEAAAAREASAHRSGGRISLEDFGFGEFPDFNHFIDQLLNRRAAPAQSTMDASAYAPDPGYREAPPEPRRGGRRDAEANLVVPLEKAFRGGRERIRLEDGRSLEVNMPAGMMTGQRIRLRGQGVGGGNLYLRIEVEPHPLFQLQGSDVFCRLPITPSEAALGSTIEIPTLDGPQRTTLPQGAQTGQRIRLVGRGYPIGQERGDLILELEVVIPTRLSDREKALYEELRHMETLNPRSPWMDRA